MELEVIREKLSDRNLAEVGRRLGVTRSWLSAFVKGGSCSEHMHKKLTAYMERN